MKKWEREGFSKTDEKKNKKQDKKQNKTKLYRTSLITNIQILLFRKLIA